VTVDAPKVLGVAAVLPMPKEETTYDGELPSGHVADRGGQGNGMRRDDDIEMVGMQVAIAYEESHGWDVEDVSAEDHGGFDLRSIRYDEDGGFEAVRYVEVKARSRTGKIRLTSNEWKKACHFGEKYWIYVVTQAATDEPELTRIQDPAMMFEEGEDIFATGFEIPEAKWRTV